MNDSSFENKSAHCLYLWLAKLSVDKDSLLKGDKIRMGAKRAEDKEGDTSLLSKMQVRKCNEHKR